MYILSENVQKRDKNYPVSCRCRFYSLPLRTFSMVAIGFERIDDSILL